MNETTAPAEVRTTRTMGTITPAFTDTDHSIVRSPLEKRCAGERHRIRHRSGAIGKTASTGSAGHILGRYRRRRNGLVRPCQTRCTGWVSVRHIRRDQLNEIVQRVRTSAASRPSTTPSPPSTRPSDARGRRSSAFVHKDSGIATDPALFVDRRSRVARAASRHHRPGPR